MAALRCALVASAVASISAEIIAAAAVPHGDFALDPSLIGGVNGSTLIHNASIALGRQLSQLKPDLIFITTPHGVALTNDFAVYQSSNGSGFALIGGDLHNASYPGYEVPMQFPLAPDLAGDLVDQLRLAGSNVTGILPWADSEAFPIRWGEVVPLWFLQSYLNDTQNAQVLIWSQPLRRYNHSVAMIPELLTVGAALYSYLQALPHRVVVIASTDLAHTHLNPVQPYPPCTCAGPFDAACGEWAATLNGTKLTVGAAALAQDAMSCGYTGLVMLHGMLAQAPMNGDAPFKPELLAIAAPTYYGMMVASFTR